MVGWNVGSCSRGDGTDGDRGQPVARAHQPQIEPMGFAEGFDPVQRVGVGVGGVPRQHHDRRELAAAKDARLPAPHLVLAPDHRVTAQRTVNGGEGSWLRDIASLSLGLVVALWTARAKVRSEWANPLRSAVVPATSHEFADPVFQVDG